MCQRIEVERQVDNAPAPVIALIPCTFRPWARMCSVATMFSNASIVRLDGQRP